MNNDMFDCKVGKYSVYFDGEYSVNFRRMYDGVIVNAGTYNGEGHFAIRKPRHPNQENDMVMWKSSREKMERLVFNDSDYSIEIVHNGNNKSERKLTFDGDTYSELKSYIPDFLNSVGYEFYTSVNDEYMTLMFD